MMKVFVSGATGFIGQRLALRLANDGKQVHALYRSPEKFAKLSHPGIHGFMGDLSDPESLLRAMEGCQLAYHVGAFAGVWARDESLIFKLNVDATLELISCAQKAGIRKVVVTSTAGILGPSGGEEVDENSPSPEGFFTPYEASKQQMEEALGKLKVPGPEIVLVNPTRVYGPGELSESNGVTRMVARYLEGKWHIIPGRGDQSGNYVHVEDVVDGHLLAMEKGKHLERYVLGGENLSYDAFFEILKQESGLNYRLYHLPVGLMLLAARLMLIFSKLSGRAPMIVPGLVRKFNHHWRVSSAKAKGDLDYAPRSVRQGLQQTLAWLKETQA